MEPRQSGERGQSGLVPAQGRWGGHTDFQIVQGSRSIPLQLGGRAAVDVGFFVIIIIQSFLKIKFAIKVHVLYCQAPALNGSHGA